MSTKPLVAVVGRPNVGKSTFFNKVCGRRISIVKNTPGVTRDRIYADAEWNGFIFTLIDTGGIEINSGDEMFAHIKKQAEAAIELADVIIFLTDGKTGPMPDDYTIASVLRKTKKPVLLAVNKLDNVEVEKTYDFYALHLGEPYIISSEHGIGIGDFLDEVVANFKDKIGEDDNRTFKIALAGKPNVGKSSLVNRLLGYERVIVSDIAGTTRDAIDTDFTIGEKSFTLIDTAGLRRKRGIEEDSVEDYSVMRAISAINRADAVLIVMDSTQEISEQDVRIAGYVHEQGKPSLVLMNKWDAVQKDTYTADKMTEDLKEKLSFMDYFVPVYVSAKTGLRTDKIIDGALNVYDNASRRIATGTLNDVLSEATALNEPPSHKGRSLKIYYITQPDTNPPKFVIFVNDARLVHFSYKRYIENALRRAFDFSGTPIEIVFKGKKEDDIKI